jgi:hypothetical protein
MNQTGSPPAQYGAAAGRGSLLQRLTGAPIDLLSPLPQDECCRRLSEAIDKPMTWFGKRPVIGRVDGLVLRASKRVPYRNSFQTELTAAFTRHDAGTRISCRFAMNQFVVVLMLSVLGVVSLVFLLTLPSVILGLLALEPGNEVQLPVLAIPAAMLVAICGIAAIGLTLAADERRFLIDFLCRTVDARPE